MEVIRELCSFEGRGPGTDAERRAANVLSGRLRRMGRRADIEPFFAHPQYATVYLIHAVLGIAGSLLATVQPAVGFALVLFDIDHFKAVNDRYGHDVGDEVLKRVAASAIEGLRSTDLIGRYGGEEFVIILPRTDADTALQIAERVRSRIEASRGGAQPKVTVSLGVATTQGDDTGHVILKRADVALYAAKDAGRNRLRLAS